MTRRSSMAVKRNQPTNEPTEKTKAAGAGAGAYTALLGLADAVGLDLSWFTDRPILVALGAALAAFVSAYNTRDRAVR